MELVRTKDTRKRARVIINTIFVVVVADARHLVDHGEKTAGHYCVCSA